MIRLRHRCGLSFKGEVTRTQQHLKKFVDVNYMISRALAGDSSVYRHGFSADVTSFPEDYQEVLNVQIRAREAYLALPQPVRDRYPTAEAFYRACGDSSEQDNLRRLGLLIPDSGKPAPVEVKVVSESPKVVNETPKVEAHA